jgi:hypothetical protein
MCIKAFNIQAVFRLHKKSPAEDPPSAGLRLAEFIGKPGSLLAERAMDTCDLPEIL